MTPSAFRRMAALGTTLILAGGTVAACGGSDEAAAPSSEATAGALTGVCPDTVVFQSDWEPEAEHASVYGMLGDDYEADAKNQTVTATLMDGDTDTGVKLEIRNGGPAVGYQFPDSLMYQDKEILLGYGRVGDSIATQDKTPVVGVMASMAKSPYAIYWDPETYPEIKTIADLKKANISILTGGEGQGSTWASFFAGSGVLDAKQYDNSADNKPAAFVAADGKVAEVGFITAEPYMYEKQIKAWGKKVVGQTMGDAGYPEYFQSIIVRKDDVTAQADCLKQLVPIIQRTVASYIEDPAPTNKKIVDIVATYDNSWQYDEGSAEYAATTAIDLGILGGSATGLIGEYEKRNVDKLIAIAKEYRTDITVPDTITSESLVTNQFLDPTITVD